MMPQIAICLGLALLSLNFVFSDSGFVIRVSQTDGIDNSSCLTFKSTQPCKSLQFAVQGVENNKNANLTDFMISLQDNVYYLRKGIEIIQTNPKRSISLMSARDNVRSIVSCEYRLAGFTVGTQMSVFHKRTQNVHFLNLEFRNCGPQFAAVVIIRNSNKISFKNCVFKENDRAGINALDSGVTVERCYFENNRANVNNSNVRYSFGATSAGGGAGFLYRFARNLSLIIRNSWFINNTAVTNVSRHFIAPSSNVTHFSTGGGGVLVVFTVNTHGCSAVIEDSKFTNNSASYGGGLYFASVNTASDNSYFLRNSSFVQNRAGQTGGGLVISQWDTTSRISCVVNNCTIRENWSSRGGGVNVFLMNYAKQSTLSTLKFDTVIFEKNQGYSSSALRFTSALPYGNTIKVEPELINCTIRDHIALSTTYTSPVMSQRVNLWFSGRNSFVRNLGAGAGEYQGCVLHVTGHVEFVNNSASQGGALLLRSSHLKLHPGSELVFFRNQANGPGGAIAVTEHDIYEFTRANNPNCFLAYINSTLPPSQWKTKVSFIENSSKIKGAALYVSSLQSCLWNEEPPFVDPNKALRWNSKFVYQNNSLDLARRQQPLSGPEYDIATDTATFQMQPQNNSTLQLQPGEGKFLNLQGMDELKHDIYSIAALSEEGSSQVDSSLLLVDSMHVVPPFTNNALPFSFRITKKMYDEIEQQKNNTTTYKIKVADTYSSLKNLYSFTVKPILCRPGFVFQEEKMECDCDKGLDGVERCGNGGIVYLKEGYWANITREGGLVTYFCPYEYCKCQVEQDLPGCMFDPSFPDAQCNDNREGWLCGQCTDSTSVGLRWFQCIDCRTSGWILGVIILAVIILCILIIWLNPGMSNELRGPLYFFQVLPYIFVPGSRISGHAFVMEDLFSFSGPLVYISNACIIKGMTNLYAAATGYLVPFLALIIFLISYILDNNNLVKFNFRKNSNLQSFWLIMLFIYTYCVETTFMLLHCPSVGGKQVFFYDGTVECFHGHHLPMAVLALLVLVTLVIPPPIIIFLITKQYWIVDPQYVNTLTRGLRPPCCWWWSLDLCRRVLLAATYAFVVDWHTRQVVMILMCVIVLAVHSNSQPYKHIRVNLTETIYLSVLCLLTIMQVLPTSSVKYIACLVSLVIVSIHAGLLTLYKAVRFSLKRFECARITSVDGVNHDPTDDSQIEQSQDTEQMMRRNILDTIFSSSGEGCSRRTSETQ